jgi:hypothetical protein
MVANVGEADVDLFCVVDLGYEYGFPGAEARAFPARPPLMPS